MHTTDIQQEQRTFLRERFLRILSSLSGQKAMFSLINKKNVSGTFIGSDIDVLHFHVKDLATPIGTQPHALIRTTDIVSVKFQEKQF